MERIREGLRDFLERRRIPSQIELNVVVFDKPVGDIEPGVYIRTNIPERMWTEDYRLRQEVGNALMMEERLQQLVGEEDADIRIPIEKGIDVEPGKGLMITRIGRHKETGCVVLKVEREPIGETVKILNIPQVRESLTEAARRMKKQEK